MRIGFIERHRTTWPIVVQCQVLAVSRSGYSEWRKRPPRATSIRRAAEVGAAGDAMSSQDVGEGSARSGDSLEEFTEVPGDRAFGSWSAVRQRALSTDADDSRHRVQSEPSRPAAAGWDNAPAESFFATLKKELVHHEVYETRTEARASLFEYIEVFDNRERLHSSLGDLSPADSEAVA